MALALILHLFTPKILPLLWRLLLPKGDSSICTTISPGSSKCTISSRIFRVAMVRQKLNHSYTVFMSMESFKLATATFPVLKGITNVSNDTLHVFIAVNYYVLCIKKYFLSYTVFQAGNCHVTCNVT